MIYRMLSSTFYAFRGHGTATCNSNRYQFHTAILLVNREITLEAYSTLYEENVWIALRLHVQQQDGDAGALPRVKGIPDHMNPMALNITVGTPAWVTDSPDPPRNNIFMFGPELIGDVVVCLANVGSKHPSVRSASRPTITLEVPTLTQSKQLILRTKYLEPLQIIRGFSCTIVSDNVDPAFPRHLEVRMNIPNLANKDEVLQCIIPYRDNALRAIHSNLPRAALCYFKQGLVMISSMASPLYAHLGPWSSGPRGQAIRADFDTLIHTLFDHASTASLMLASYKSVFNFEILKNPLQRCQAKLCHRPWDDGAISISSPITDATARFIH